MVRAGVIEPSASPWSYPVVLIKKTTGTYKFCIDIGSIASSKDQRHLGKASTGEVHQYPRPEARVLQVPLAEESRPITAFTVPELGSRLCRLAFIRQGPRSRDC